MDDPTYSANRIMLSVCPSNRLNCESFKRDGEGYNFTQLNFKHPDA